MFIHVSNILYNLFFIDESQDIKVEKRGFIPYVPRSKEPDFKTVITENENHLRQPPNEQLLRPMIPPSFIIPPPRGMTLDEYLRIRSGCYLPRPLFPYPPHFLTSPPPRVNPSLLCPYSLQPRFEHEKVSRLELHTPRQLEVERRELITPERFAVTHSPQYHQKVIYHQPGFEAVELRAEEEPESKSKVYRCQECGKEFRRPSSLSTHKLIHSDHKPFPCSYCGKKFLRKSDMKKHTLMHTGAKPFQCKQCGKVFSQSSNMLTHMRRHTGVKPFPCKICGRRFYRKVDVRRHTLRHEFRANVQNTGVNHANVKRSEVLA